MCSMSPQPWLILTCSTGGAQAWDPSPSGDSWTGGNAGTDTGADTGAGDSWGGGDNNAGGGDTGDDSCRM